MKYLLIVLLLVVANYLRAEDMYNNYTFFSQSKNNEVYAISVLSGGGIFPVELKAFTSIANLEIKNCNILQFTYDFSCFTKLESIIFDSCQIQSYSDLFDKIVQIPHLNILTIKNDSNFIIPSNIQNLKTLKGLEIEHDNLMEIPEYLFYLDSLSYLSVDANNIKIFNINDSINCLLDYLKINNNELTSLPKGIEKLKSLKFLYLNDNPNLQLEEICDILPHLENLELLAICNTGKTEYIPLPKNISNLVKLKTVIITENHYSIEDLKILDELRINYIFLKGPILH
jgi:Leucine-rich repeat (LRR) protein